MRKDENKTFFNKAKKEEIKVSDIFSEVFRKHTKEENARVFVAGTALTTPDEGSMLAKWVKPYMFLRFLLLGIAIFVLAFLTALGTSYAYPFLFIFGAFIIPITVALFYWELNIPRNVSFQSVLVMILLGGILSLLFTTWTFSFYNRSSTFMYCLSVGLFEEAAKVAAAIPFVKGKDKKHILTGLLVGAAIGAGFSAIETAGYAIIKGGWSLSLLLMRMGYAIGGHIAYAPIAAAGLVWAKGDEPLAPKHFIKKEFLGCFAIAVAAHTAWDLYAAFPMFVVKIVVEYVVIFYLIKKGLKQVVDASLRYNNERMTYALDHDMFDNPGGSATAPVQGQAQAKVLDSGVRLQCVSGAMNGKRYALRDNLRIGRTPGMNDIVYPSNTAGVSGTHCQVMFQGGRIYVKDLNSTYGTYIDGKRLNPNQVYEIFLGSQIGLGSMREAFRIEEKSH